jgi:hypothetical protein
MQDTTVSDIGWLIIATLAVGMISFLILDSIHDEHTVGDRPLTADYTECVSDQLDRSVQTGEFDEHACDPDMPWYAERPVPYALGLAAAVFVVGGMVVLLHRTQGRQ